MRFYSLIVPVFNRPDEVEDLLKCLATQTYRHFELVLVESGSTIPSDEVVAKYKEQVTVRHFMYKNDGQGFSRNYGMSKAEGDFFVILDSDILLDPDYLENLDHQLHERQLDAFGGPDRAHHSFSPVQKAIDYTLTAPLTTGGIRGAKKRVGTFYPRSFNMGFSREVYDKTGGFHYPYFGEDIDLSQRIMDNGFRVGLVREAYVYHKRKKTFQSFYKQMFFFGRARIQISKLFPSSLKITHFFPALFVLSHLLLVVFIISFPQYTILWLAPLLLYIFVLFLGSAVLYKSPRIGFLTIPALYTQMFGYGLGFMKDFIRRMVFNKDSHVLNKKE